MVGQFFSLDIITRSSRDMMRLAGHWEGGVAAGSLAFGYLLFMIGQEIGQSEGDKLHSLDKLIT
jgi:hypothetical protein